MSAVADARRATGPTAIAAPRAASNGWWAMILLVATEAALFLTLIASYFYLQFKAPGSEWPPGEIKDPKLAKPIAMTAILLFSSLPMYAAEAGIRRGNVGRLRWGLLVTLLLGILFLLLQASEYQTKVQKEDLTPQRNAYASMFFTITALHGAHVLVGVVMIAWALLWAWRGAYSAERHLGVQMSALYWHFVDVVWLLAVFPSLYLSPHAA